MFNGYHSSMYDTNLGLAMRICARHWNVQTSWAMHLGKVEIAKLARCAVVDQFHSNKSMKLQPIYNLHQPSNRIPYSTLNCFQLKLLDP